MRRSRVDGQARAPRRFSSFSERLANLATRFVVHPMSHWLATALVVAWLASGPAFAARPEVYDTIEQVVGGLSFLMLFLLQRSQSKDTLALQLKLDELVASNPRASNRVLNAEEVSEEELAAFRRHFAILQELSREASASPLTQAEAYRRHAEEQERLAAGSGGSEETR